MWKEVSNFKTLWKNTSFEICIEIMSIFGNIFPLFVCHEIMICIYPETIKIKNKNNYEWMGFYGTSTRIQFMLHIFMSVFSYLIFKRKIFHSSFKQFIWCLPVCQYVSNFSHQQSVWWKTPVKVLLPHMSRKH